MIRLVIIFAITSIIFFIIYNSCQIEEPYDAMVNYMTETGCGNLCTKGEGCAGFAYKPSENRCFLSKEPLFGQPVNRKYDFQYSNLDRRCNKINMLSDTKLLNELTLTENSIYACTDGAVGTASRYQYANNGSTLLDEINKTNVPTQVTYKIEPIAWDTEIDYLDLTAKPTNPPVFTDVTFIESPDEYLGQYMTPYKCVSDIPLYSCLRVCEESGDCVGVEYNPSFESNGEKYANLCCPKRMVNRKMKRREAHENGRFYVKDKRVVKNAIRIYS